MSAGGIDVEAQLRQWREEQKEESELLVSFMNWENFYLVQPVAIPLLGVTIIACIVILVVPLFGRKTDTKRPGNAAHCYAENLRSTRALAFASLFNPFFFSAYLAVLLLTCAINAVTRLMLAASTDATLTSGGPEDPVKLFLHPAPLLFVLQFWGILSLLIHVLFTVQYRFVGCLAALPPFLVTFYQTAILADRGLDREPAWFINAALCLSSCLLVAFTVPWVKHEYRLALREFHSQSLNSMSQRRKFLNAGTQKKRS